MSLWPSRSRSASSTLQLEPLGERAVPLVDVEIVALEEVVGHVDIGPSVTIDVAHHHAQTQADLASEDARRRADVHEVSGVVAIQLRAAERIPLVARVLERRSEEHTSELQSHV